MDYDIESELIPRDFPIIRDGVYMKNGAYSIPLHFLQSKQLLISEVF
jgi:hypothetical protein